MRHRERSWTRARSWCLALIGSLVVAGGAFADDCDSRAVPIVPSAKQSRVWEITQTSVSMYTVDLNVDGFTTSVTIQEDSSPGQTANDIRDELVAVLPGNYTVSVVVCNSTRALVRVTKDSGEIDPFLPASFTDGSQRLQEVLLVNTNAVPSLGLVGVALVMILSVVIGVSVRRRRSRPIVGT